MRGWSYAPGSPDLEYLYFLTLEELQVLWSLTCIWKRDNDPEVGSTIDFDSMMRTGLRKLTDETGYRWRAGITIDAAGLDVWVEDTTHFPHATAVRGFLEHLATSLTMPHFPWPNYEQAFTATIDFLDRELPQQRDLITRVVDELIFIRDEVARAKLGGYDQEQFEESIREQEMTHSEFREFLASVKPLGGIN